MLLVDKPAGVTSHDIVGAARRALGESRVGHTGTLDPFATGLLILLIGRATRLAQYVPDEPKVYEAVVQFGTETDTEDLDGTVTRTAALPTRAALTAALAGRVGTLEQVPPSYSAKRIGGVRAYALARVGTPVALAPAMVTVHAIEQCAVEEAEGFVRRATLRVTCAGGTYVRSLARDIARDASSAAHLVSLRRHSAGGFRVANAITLADLTDGDRAWAAVAPPLTALDGYPRQPLTADEVALVVRGIDVEARVAGPHAALIDGALIAFAERRSSERGDRWQPRVVMRDPAS